MAAARGGHTKSAMLRPLLTRSNHAGVHVQFVKVCSSREHHVFSALWMFFFMLESKEPISDCRNIEGIEGF